MLQITFFFVVTLLKQDQSIVDIPMLVCFL